MAVGHPTRSSSFFIENIIGNPNQGQPWSMLTKMDRKESFSAHSSSPHQFLQPLLQDAPAIPAHTASQSSQTSSHDSSILTTTIDSKTNIHTTKLRHHQQTGKSFDH